MPGDISHGSTANLKSCVDDAVNELTHSDSSNINGALTHVKFLLDSYGSQRVTDPTTRRETTFADAFRHAAEQELAQRGELERVVKNFADANYGSLSQGMHYLHPTQLNDAEVAYNNSGRWLEADFTRDLINIGDNTNHHKLDRYVSDGEKASASRMILTQFDSPAAFDRLANHKGHVTADDISGALSATPDRNQIAPLQYMQDHFREISQHGVITRESVEKFAARAGITPDMVATAQPGELDWRDAGVDRAERNTSRKWHQGEVSDSSRLSNSSPDNIVDDRGRTFKFEKLDKDGNPTLVETPRGTMERMTGDKWFWHRRDPNNPNYSRLDVWHGSITQDGHGGWQWLGNDGRISRLNSDGSRSSEYGGVVTKFHSDGSSTLQFEDGSAIESSVMGGLHRTVKHGVTTDARIMLNNAICQTKRNGNDLYAEIQTEPNNAITAIQPGVVVFSSRKADEGDKRKAIFGLTQEDLAAIERLKRLDADNQNMVIVRCTQPDKDKGYFNEVYSGLSQGNVVAGDHALQGTILGRVGQNGTFNLSIRRNTVGGAAVAISVARSHSEKASQDGDEPTSSL